MTSYTHHVLIEPNNVEISLGDIIFTTGLAFQSNEEVWARVIIGGSKRAHIRLQQGGRAAEEGTWEQRGVSTFTTSLYGEGFKSKDGTANSMTKYLRDTFLIQVYSMGSGFRKKKKKNMLATYTYRLYNVITGPKRYVINNKKADHFLSFSLNTHHLRRPSVLVSELFLHPEQQLWQPSHRHTMSIELSSAEGRVWTQHQPQMKAPPATNTTIYTSPSSVAGNSDLHAPGAAGSKDKTVYHGKDVQGGKKKRKHKYIDKGKGQGTSRAKWEVDCSSLALGIVKKISLRDLLACSLQLTLKADGDAVATGAVEMSHFFPKGFHGTSIDARVVMSSTETFQRVGILHIRVGVKGAPIFAQLQESLGVMRGDTGAAALYGIPLHYAVPLPVYDLEVRQPHMAPSKAYGRSAKVYKPIGGYAGPIAPGDDYSVPSLPALGNWIKLRDSFGKSFYFRVSDRKTFGTRSVSDIPKNKLADLNVMSLSAEAARKYLHASPSMTAKDTALPGTADTTNTETTDDEVSGGTDDDDDDSGSSSSSSSSSSGEEGTLSSYGSYDTSGSSGRSSSGSGGSSDSSDSSEVQLLRKDNKGKGRADTAKGSGKRKGKRAKSKVKTKLQVRARHERERRRAQKRFDSDKVLVSDKNVSPDDLQFASIRWKGYEVANGPAACEGAAMTADTDGETIYLFGGGTGTYWHNQLWAFDVESKVWRSLSIKGAVPKGRTGHTFNIFSRGKALLFGGGTNEGRQQDTWMVRLGHRSSHWKKVQTSGPKPYQRTRHSADVIGKYLYVFAGRAGYRYLGYRYHNDMFKLHTKSWTWELVAAGGHIPKARAGHQTAVTHDNKLLCFGGYQDGVAHMNDVHIFDPQENMWYLVDLQGGPKPAPRESFTMLSLHGGSEMVISNGDGKHRPFSDSWVFHVPSLSWHKVKEEGVSPGKCWGQSCTQLPGGNTGFIYGGDFGFGFRKTLWTVTSTLDTAAEADSDSDSVSETGLSTLDSTLGSTLDDSSSSSSSSSSGSDSSSSSSGGGTGSDSGSAPSQESRQSLAKKLAKEAQVKARAMKKKKEKAGRPNRKEDNLCVVCMDRTISIRLEPCGHDNLCRVCTQHLTKCPVCRKGIKHARRLSEGK